MTKLLSMTVAMGTLLLALGACDDDDNGRGAVAFSTWGEELIEKEIPATEVEDGWTIRYRKFLVVLGGIRVADARGELAAEMQGSKLFDMTKPGVKAVVTFPALEEKHWEHVSYEIRPADAQTELAGATDADKALMTSSGYSIYVEGEATKGAAKKTYTWGFKTKTLYDRCEGELAGKTTPGVVVTNGGTDQPQITIHGDHLYYDDLQSPDAKVRFDNIASADANDDGEITLAELASIKLAAIPKERGAYGTGSASGVNDLGAFVAALSRTVGHFRGEGECFAAKE